MNSHHQCRYVILIIIKTEAGSGRTGGIQMLHEWLAAMMPGTNGNTVFASYLCDVVRMNAVDIE